MWVSCTAIVVAAIWFLPPDIVRDEIGLGTFGKVFRCLDKKYDDEVAIKVVRNIRKYVESAVIEARILNDIFDQQKKKKFDGCLKIYSHFKYNGV